MPPCAGGCGSKRHARRGRQPHRRPAIPSRRRKPARRNAWSRWSDERLLATRFCDLRLELGGSWIEARAEQLWSELAARGLPIRPHVWLSTEFFSPEGVPGIAVPFYLAHPRLTRLERRMMLGVEGGTVDDCMRILRHEAGHAVQHAWRLQRREAWRDLFGSSSKRYPEVYRPNPASQRFVQHLPQYYAQAHPDEDFAETFAVWLTPGSNWRRRYAGWPALKKLEWVDTLARELTLSRPPIRTRRTVEPLPRVRMTLAEHYLEKQSRWARHRPSIPDRDLQRLFPATPGRRGATAWGFVRTNRAEIRALTARWTGESPYAIDRVIDDVASRCRLLGLRATGSGWRLRVDVAALLALRTVHYHYSRRNWIAL